MIEFAQAMSALVGQTVTLTSIGPVGHLKTSHGTFDECTWMPDTKTITVKAARYIVVGLESHHIEVRPGELSVLLSRNNAYGAMVVDIVAFTNADPSDQYTIAGHLRSAKHMLEEWEAQ